MKENISTKIKLISILVILLLLAIKFNLFIDTSNYLYANQNPSNFGDNAKIKESFNKDGNNIELFTGNTMGTTYHIKVVMQMDKSSGREGKSGGQEEGKNKTQITPSILHDLIKEKLKQVNQSMSVYIKDSEISLFNKSHKGESINISPEFHGVMVSAQKLYTMTKGAWDGTVKPLVDLWGFGTRDQKFTEPSSKIIKAYLQNTGFNQILIKNEVAKNIDSDKSSEIPNIGNKIFGTLEKKNDAITLDLGSIAKGFGVDAVAQLLKSQGYSNFLVEIGGEVFASGEKKEGNPWIVGISNPIKGENPYKSTKYDLDKEQSEINQVYHALPLKNKALATSGDYRNFKIINGKTYSHIINPTTGYPVDNGVVSVSVIADNCTFADGLATALMVMGHEKGVELVNTLENVECLIVVQEEKFDENNNVHGKNIVDRGSNDDAGNNVNQKKSIKFKDYRSRKFPLP
ncbi:MAG: FAD:protein FMN transferase [Desulfamplus sp.]|nr:FAD:protein FMN transferase [Desulfamplus sp.]